MGCLSVVFTVALVSGFFQNTNEMKPKMNPDNDTLFLDQSEELKIECYSKGARLQFSFSESTSFVPPSEYEIHVSADGTYTFLRRHASLGDTGWYACAEEGFKIDNDFRSVNHTDKDVSWIYVYVNNTYWKDSVYFVGSGLSNPLKTMISVPGSVIVIPCRTTQPTSNVELWQNFKVSDLLTKYRSSVENICVAYESDKCIQIDRQLVDWEKEGVRFDPEVGFIMKQVEFLDNEAILQCKTDDTQRAEILLHAGSRPTMITPKDDKDIILQEGNVLRIQCFSSSRLTFLYPTILTNSSEYEIADYGNGMSTFLRHSVTSDDTGWYGCAGVGIENHDIPEYSINYTKKEISWVYVYVNSAVKIISPLVDTVFFDPSRHLYLVVIPCRPTTPETHIQLEEWNGTIWKSPQYSQFDQKVGHLIISPHIVGNETSVYRCVMTEPVRYVSRNYSFADVNAAIQKSLKAAILNVDDVLNSDDLIIRMTGDALHMRCDTVVSTMTSCLLKWTVPNTVAANRIKYKRTRSKGCIDFDVVYSRKKTLEITVTNLSETDSGEYMCSVESDWNHRTNLRLVEVFDKAGSQYLRLGEQVNSLTITGQKGGTVKWLLDLTDCPSAKIGQYGYHDQQITNIEDRFQIKTASKHGAPLLLFAMTNLTAIERGSYRLFFDDMDEIRQVQIDVNVQEPPTARLNSTRGLTQTGETRIDAYCWSFGSPEPNNTIAFAECPKYPSLKNCNLGYGRESYEVGEANGWKICHRQLNIRMSGILSCKACNVLGCTVATEDIKFSASDHPYFTSTNLNKTKLVLDMVSSALILECYAAGDPYPNVTWFKNGVRLENGKQHKFAYDNRELFIPYFSSNDSGRYTCRAENVHGYVENYIDVILQGPQTVQLYIAITERLQTGEMGIDARCWSVGSPEQNPTIVLQECPKYPSLKSCTSRSGSGLYDIITSNEGKIYRWQFNISMSGILTCEACNILGCSVATKHILFYASEEPYFTSTNLNRTEVILDMDKPIILECYAAGDPYPNVTWFKDDVLLDDCKPRKYDDRELKIFPYFGDDGGRYTCRAENVHGSVENYMDIIFQEAAQNFNSVFGEGVLSLSMVAAVVTLSVLLVICCIIIYRQYKKASRKKLADLAFEKGALRRFNPELSVVDQAELLPYDLKWEYPRGLLKLDKTLGSGAFGIVKKAEAKSICHGEAVTTVAVKLVRSTASLNFMTALTRELKILAYLGKHPNVVNLLGACTKNVFYGELYVIVEYCRFGNLRDHLLNGRDDFVDQISVVSENVDSTRLVLDCTNTSDRGLRSSVDGGEGSLATAVHRSPDTDVRENSEASDDDCDRDHDSGEAQRFRSKYEGDYTNMDLEPICTRDLVYWSWQVSRGMEFLGQRKIVHGDLAARNILLADNGIVKVCDFGLAKALYNEAEYRDQGGNPLPIKWMAIESIKDLIFSVQSDVWSFGIVMWEIFSLGETPYPGMRQRGLVQKLIDGYRMGHPKYAAAAMYDMMRHCWNADPAKRPSFNDMSHNFGELLDDGFKTQYLEMHAQYMEMSAEALNDGKEDYLTMSPSAIAAASSSKVEVQIGLQNSLRDVPETPV